MPSLPRLAPTRTRRNGFSLIEVVLAIGIFLITVLALVGLLGPTLQSVDEVEKTDEVSSVVNTLNAFLQNSPAIATASQSKFGVIFNNVASGDHATVFVFRAYRDSANTEVTDLSTQVFLQVGFADGETVGDPSATISASDVIQGNTVKAAGPIYRCVLTASSVIPEEHRSPTRNANNIYTLAKDLANYPEGYFAMEVRIFAEDPPGPGQSFNPATDLNAIKDAEPIFTYNTAVVR